MNYPQQLRCRPPEVGRHLYVRCLGHRLPAWFLLAVFSACLGPGAVAYADWPMFAAGPAHRGMAAQGPGPTVAVLWSLPLGSSVDSSPAVMGERVFVGTADGEVCALEAEGGELIWRYSTGGAVVSSPAVAQGRVVFGSVDRFLYCVTASEGVLLWKHRTWGPVVSSPTVVDSVVYGGSMDGTVTALELETGALRWQVQESAGISCSPAVASGLVIYGDRAGTVKARRAETGAEVWSAASRCPVVASPTISTDIALVPYMSYSQLVPPKVEYLVAYDLTTGEKRWALSGARSVFTTPAVADKVIYFATVEGYLSKTELRAVKLEDGTLLWKQNLPPIITTSPAVAGDYLYVGAGDGAVYCVSRTSGEILGRVSLAPKLFSSPALAGGRLYLGANDGQLYCLAGGQ